MAKLKIKKRKRSLGQRIDALAEIPGRIANWWARMTGHWVYREVFWPALWGEMAEYGVRFSTFAGLFWLAIGIGGFAFMPGSRHRGLVWLIYMAIFIACVIIGVRQFLDLQGPLWWADRFAVRAVNDYRRKNRFRRYERCSSYYQSHVNAAPLLRYEEIMYLCELYRQLVVGIISAESLDELGTYTAAEINYFYRLFDIRPTDPQFPQGYIGRYVHQ